MKKIENNKGVTLVALVITIIVLIILAAVSLATLTGDNTIFTRSQEARDDTAVSQSKDLINTALSSIKVEATAIYYSDGGVSGVATYLKGLGNDVTKVGLSDNEFSLVNGASETGTGTLTITANDTSLKITSGTITFDAEDNKTGLISPSVDATATE